MSVRRWSHVFLAVLVGSLAAACETNTSPDRSTPFDLGTALSDHEALDSALSAEGLAGLRALSGRTPFGTFDAGASPARAPIISDLHRGVTFVYDPTLDEYVVDPDRLGAPATGVRFILYELDSAGRPLADREIGHADLVDEGDGSVEDIVLHMMVVEGGAKALDYRAALDDHGSGGSLSVGGYLVGRNVRLDFAIEAVGAEEGPRSSGDVTFDLRIDARDFQVTGRVHGMETGAKDEGEIEVTARHADESFRVDATGRNGMIDGSVELNGELFATVSGRSDHPKFLGATGDPLTGVEFLVLWHVIDSVEDVFDLLEDLVDPVDELVFLGAIL